MLQNLQSEITSSKQVESADIHRLQGLITTLQTTTMSEIGTVQSKLKQVNDTLFNIFKPNGKFFVFLYYFFPGFCGYINTTNSRRNLTFLYTSLNFCIKKGLVLFIKKERLVDRLINL